MKKKNTKSKVINISDIAANDPFRINRERSSAFSVSAFEVGRIANPIALSLYVYILFCEHAGMENPSSVDLAKYFNLPRKVVEEALHYLVAIKCLYCVSSEEEPAEGVA